MKTLASTILSFCVAIKQPRTRTGVLASVMSEAGELATEVAIKQGDSYKKEGPDGIVGESIDLIISAVDQIYVENPNITEEELIEIALPKLHKWAAGMLLRSQGASVTNSSKNN